jgi:SpoVK/Ycf46/Vps4 family AAA+-type ATPase
VFTQNDVSVILLTETLTDVNPRLASSPSTIKITIPFPDEAVRSQFIAFLESRDLFIAERGLTPEKMGSLTSGLNLLNLNQLVAESYQEDRPISLDYLRDRKREIIENEAAGLIEFVDTSHDLSYVSGCEFVKNRFKNAAKAIRQNHRDVLPMGYLIAGPVGTGKSFLVSAFAGEIGIPMVKLRNFRSKWQGATESNLEKVLNILKAMSPVAVMIDEADAFLGDRNQDGDSGTSSRVFAQIASFMGDTEYRGRILWFLITCRPDLLPIDLKRQGRAEEHLALFYPETVEERIHLFETLQRKADIKVNKFPLLDIFRKFQYDLSGADIEAILVRARMRAAVDNRIIVSRDDLEQTIKDFIPPSYPHEIELQNLVAVLECTSREMVPQRYRNMDYTKLASRIREIKQLLGE